MPKQLEHSDEARAALKRGIDIMAETVGVTLGPRGRNVVIDDDFAGPKVSSDGVTIAKEIVLEDPYENMGAQLLKEAASKTNENAGDGTTTATVLAQAIIHEGFRNIAAGANPMLLKKGIDRGVVTMRDAIREMAQPVSGREQIGQVATLAAHDDEMGELIANVIEKVGKDGVITVEESKGLEYEQEYVEGMEFDKGYMSPYFATNQERMIAEIEDPYILITDKKISAVSRSWCRRWRRSFRSARTSSSSRRTLKARRSLRLVVNRLRGAFTVLAIKAPAFGDRRTAMLEDMAILTGATVISENVGRNLDSITMDDLGRARRVVSTKDETTIVDGGGSSEAVTGRMNQLRAQIEDTTSDYDSEKLEERLAKLSGGVAILKVGAATEVELKEKKQRIEDALGATRAAVDEGIVPGGGVTLVRAGEALDSLDLPTADEQTGLRILKTALRAPLKLISENTGVSGEVVLSETLKQEGSWGYNAETGEYGDLLELGIIDPAKVTRSAVENAASLAAMVLTTESVITDIIEKPKPGQPAMPDYYD